MLQLHQRDVIGKTAHPDAQGRQDPIRPAQRHEQQPPEIEQEFLKHGERAMRLKIAVVAVSEHDEPVIQRPVKDMLPHIAPMAGGQGRLHVRPFERAAHGVHAHLHQSGMAVTAAAFIGDPVGPHIAFFKDMNRESALARLFDRLCMDGADVAIQHNIRDLTAVDQVDEPVPPVVQRAAIGQVTLGVEPKSAVACVETNAPDLCPGLAQHGAQAVKERSMRPLQEKKDPFVAGCLAHGAALCPKSEMIITV